MSNEVFYVAVAALIVGFIITFVWREKPKPRSSWMDTPTGPITAREAEAMRRRERERTDRARREDTLNRLRELTKNDHDEPDLYE